MHFYTHSLKSHGSGPVREAIIELLGWKFRVGYGGYGNVPSPIGSWTLIPKVSTKYRYFRLTWLNAELAIFPKGQGQAVLVGYRRWF